MEQAQAGRPGSSQRIGLTASGADIVGGPPPSPRVSLQVRFVVGLLLISLVPLAVSAALIPTIAEGAQRAAMNMVQRNPTHGKAVSNVDAFVQNADISKMPSFARGKATELLAKANGKGEVRKGFQKLAGDRTFKAQTAQNKGRFFSTIGTGRPSEFRAITDKQLTALQSPGFPKRTGQVQKFLGKMSQQIQSGVQSRRDTF